MVCLAQSMEGVMTVWRVEVYDNRDDSAPSRRGFVEADSEHDAVEAARKAMGEAARAALDVRVEKCAGLPRGCIVWEN